MLKIIALIALCLIVFPPPSYAYIDPGSGSYVIQILVAGLLGFLYSIKLFWSKIRAAFEKWVPNGRKSRPLK